MGLGFFSYLCAEIETKNFINIWKGVNDMIQRQLQDVIESRMFKCYIIFKLSGFIRNLRTELKKAKKFYFYDNGIRNAILQNFAPLSLRQDVGALWENFFISERLKANQYAGRYVNSYFWRTNQQQEIDYIEECDGQFSLFEMKWNPKRANTQFPEYLSYCIRCEGKSHRNTRELVGMGCK